jgi:hypothetical protein
MGDYKTNLLMETLEILENNGKSPEDVMWVGDKNQFTTWKDFVANANFEYDAGFGGNEIDMDLKVVGRNWWLERHEYDGSEWWEFKTLPSKPKVKSGEIPKKIEYDW